MSRDIEYWAAPAPMTDLEDVPEHALAGLPDDPVALCRIAAGVMVHEAWAPAYGFEVPADRVEEVELRPAAAIVAAILALDDRPLVEPRPVEQRVVGVCRHFTTLSVALLRVKGIPARSRCGFGSYFERGKYIDHWIVERWDDASARWIPVDTQFDELATKVLRLDFDPTDVPRDRFYAGGAAWELARSGSVAPKSFGIYDFWGWPILRGNLIRDIAALNKVELLPWDLWGDMKEDDDPDAYGDELARASGRRRARRAPCGLRGCTREGAGGNRVGSVPARGEGPERHLTTTAFGRVVPLQQPDPSKRWGGIPRT